jgi:hypothetical protein
MKEKNRRFLSISARYLILLFIALPNFWIFYALFTPLTIYFVNLTLSIFFETFRAGSTIILDGRISIEIIPACIAGSAYYLLLILNLSIAKINLKTRINMILLSFVAFFFINVIRIFILSTILLSNFKVFVVSKIFQSQRNAFLF